MTFYNIIFAVLFFGAVRELFMAAVDFRPLQLLMASTLALVVFNDTLYTSHSLHEDKATYTVGMKLLDLGSFLVLASAIFILSPGATYFVNRPSDWDVDPQTKSTLFWLVLTGYWFLALGWNRLAERAMPQIPKSKSWITQSMFVLPLLAFVVSLFRNDCANIVAGAIVLVPLLLYVVVYKPLRPDR